jgi:hypothetical protein
MIENFENFVGGRALGGNAADAANHRTEFSGSDAFAKCRSRSLRDASFHQRAAEIACSCLKTRQRELETHFEPRDLNSGNVAMQKQARKGTNDQIFLD